MKKFNHSYDIWGIPHNMGNGAHSIFKLCCIFYQGYIVSVLTTPRGGGCKKWKIIGVVKKYDKFEQKDALFFT